MTVCKILPKGIHSLAALILALCWATPALAADLDDFTAATSSSTTTSSATTSTSTSTATAPKPKGCFCPADENAGDDACAAEACQNNSTECKRNECLVPVRANPYPPIPVHPDARQQDYEDGEWIGVRCMPGNAADERSSCSCPPQGKEGWPPPIDDNFMYKCINETSFNCEEARCGIWNIALGEWATQSPISGMPEGEGFCDEVATGSGS